MALAQKFPAAFRSVVFAIGLTDSAHYSIRDEIGEHLHQVNDRSDKLLWIFVKELIYYRSVEIG